ncbi:unnamed protein product [Polarella glacialis]|nr:unnamed protein product [Polarella glacialis]
MGSYAGINASFVYVPLAGRQPQARQRVEVISTLPFKSAALRPRGSPAVRVVGQSIFFDVDRPGKFILELDGDHEIATLATGLMIFADFRDDVRADSDQPSVLHFGPGLHELPYDSEFGGRLLRLANDTTVHLDAGAVVLGYVRGDGLRNVTIRGPGILAASFWPGASIPPGQAKGASCGYFGPIALQISNSSDITLDGFTIVHSTSWNVKLESSTNVHVRGLNIIAWQCMNDGIDVVSSQGVVIEGCFIRSNDDAIALKGTDPTMETRDVLVQDNVLWGQSYGNCMEIGFELWNAGVSNVSFIRNVCFHSARAAMSIHNAGHTAVHGIKYQDITVEGVFSNDISVDENQGLQLLDITIIAGRYSGPDLGRRGSVADVLFSNVTYHPNKIRYLFSRLLGNSSSHRISDVVFDHFRIGDSIISSLADLNATSSFLGNVAFRTDRRTDQQGIFV